MAQPRLDALARTARTRATPVIDERVYDHWFDRLNMALVREGPRRTLLRAAVASVTSLGLEALPVTEAARNRNKGNGRGRGKYKRKGKNKHKKKDKSPPKPPTDWSRTCSRGSCFLAYPSDSEYDLENRKWCEYVCEQCDGDDPRQFCLLLGEVADCCDAGLTCCGDKCVAFGTADHCTGCDEPCRQDGRTCCPTSNGFHSCVDTTSSRHHCGGCGQLCLHPDKQCCDSSCQDVKFNNAHCGSCAPCTTAQPECCHGSCYDPEVRECCHNHPPNSAESCYKPDVCCTLANGLPGCCRP